MSALWYSYPQPPMDTAYSPASTSSSSSDESSQHLVPSHPWDSQPSHSRRPKSRGGPALSGSSTTCNIPHPYARLYAKKDEVKRRKIWNHALEKSVFTSYELSTIGAPQRRTIYISSLEAHIDKLHNQMLGLGYYPIAFEELEPYRGLNSKTAKSIVASLQYDLALSKLKLLELERANASLHQKLSLD